MFDSQDTTSISTPSTYNTPPREYSGLIFALVLFFANISLSVWGYFSIKQNSDELIFYIIQFLFPLVLFLISVPIFGRQNFLKWYMFSGFLSISLIGFIVWKLFFNTVVLKDSQILFYNLATNYLPLLAAALYLVFSRKKENFYTSRSTSFAAGLLLTLPIGYITSALPPIIGAFSCLAGLSRCLSW